MTRHNLDTELLSSFSKFRVIENFKTHTVIILIPQTEARVQSISLIERVRPLGVSFMIETSRWWHHVLWSMGIWPDKSWKVK